MDLHPECIPCLFRQGLNALELSTSDDEDYWEFARRLSRELAERDPRESTPAEYSTRVLWMVREVTGESDPYGDLKRKWNRIALGMYGELAQRVASSEDPLHTALLVAVAGNVIDFGIGKEFDVAATLEEVLAEGFAFSDYDLLRGALDETDELLYLADNAGEILFDRILVEELGRLGKSVTVAVKSGPILNDATLEDAAEAGICETADVVTTGCDSVGAVLGWCSDEFRELFRSAPLVIAKGQGNYETLDCEEGRIFSLLKAKCPVVARSLGIAEGGVALKLVGSETST